MKQSIFRNGGLLKWSDTFGTALDKMNELSNQPDPDFAVSLYGDKGFGKSTILEFISETYHVIAVEGDIATMFSIGMFEEQPLDVRIDTFAKGPSNPWTRYSGKNHDKRSIAAAHLPNLEKVQLWTEFQGCLAPDVYGAIVPDYKSYCDHLSTRTAKILSGDGNPEWREHVRKGHKVMTYVEFVQWFSQSPTVFKRPTVYFPNIGNDHLIRNTWESIALLMSQREKH